MLSFWFQDTKPLVSYSMDFMVDNAQPPRLQGVCPRLQLHGVCVPARNQGQILGHVPAVLGRLPRKHACEHVLEDLVQEAT